MKYKTLHYGDKPNAGDVLITDSKLRLHCKNISIHFYSYSRNFLIEKHFNALVLGISAQATFRKSPQTKDSE